MQTTYRVIARLVHPTACLAGYAILSMLLLAACSSAAQTPSNEASDIYRPPTAAPQTPLATPFSTLTPTASNLSEGLLPSATPACTDGLRFLEDLTIPDGTQVAPGAAVDKQWKIENSGTCNWGEAYRLRLVEGPNLGAPEEQALYPARGGTQAVIRMLFTAPAEPGAYRSAWQAVDPQGQAFGETIYVYIEVIAALTTAP